MKNLSALLEKLLSQWTSLNRQTAVEVRKFKDYEIKLKLAEAIAKGDRSLNEMLTEFKVPERTFYRWKKHPEFQQVWEKAKNYSNTLITADSAEPKSIDEFKSYNMKVVGAKRPSANLTGLTGLTGLGCKIYPVNPVNPVYRLILNP